MENKQVLGAGALLMLIIAVLSLGLWLSLFRKREPSSSKMQSTRAIIENIRESGDDTSIPRPVNFLFVGERSKLDKLAEYLNSVGYEKIPSNYSEPEKSLLVTRTMDVDSLVTTNIILKMENLAEEASVVFDGWETEPIK